MSRTTHSDLALLLEIFVEKLRNIPEGYCVSDPASLAMIESVAKILVAQDERIGHMTRALSMVRPTLPEGVMRDIVNGCLAMK